MQKDMQPEETNEYKKCHEKSLKYKKVAMPQKPQRKTRF